MTPVDVYLTDVKLRPSYAGTAPGFAGLNQVNFIIPQSLGPGTYQLRIATPDNTSRAVPLFVTAP
jgi:uncharacterized protein (TIGR03437 family)